MTSMSMEVPDLRNPWQHREVEESFFSLALLHERLEGREAFLDRVDEVSIDRLKVTLGQNGNSIELQLDDRPSMGLTHWSFAQLCELAGRAPAAYLRRIHPVIAVKALNYGLVQQHSGKQELIEISIDGDPGGDIGPRVASILPAFSAVAGVCQPSYLTLLRFLEGNMGPEWQVPGRSPVGYLSDRTLEVFLVSTRPILTEMARRNSTVHRGLYFRTSEVGSTTFFVEPFLWLDMPASRIFWGTPSQRAYCQGVSNDWPQIAAAGRRWFIRYTNALASGARALSRAAELPAHFGADWLRDRKFAPIEIAGIIRHAETLGFDDFLDGWPAATAWDVAAVGSGWAKNAFRLNSERVLFEQKLGALLAEPKPEAEAR